MMKMSARITSCCVALLLTLTSVAAVRRVLNSNRDLQSIDCTQTVLLRWFANTVDIDRNNVIHLTFDPNSDYTSHHYGNYERVLNRPPRGSQYYTIGNINKPTSRQLPAHVQTQLGEGNRARIIIRVREQNVRAQQVDRVYITQHYEMFDMSEYDPEQTYEITPNFLREIRASSTERYHMNTGPQLHYYNQSKLHSAQRGDDLWSNIQNCVGFLCRLLLFLVLAIVFLVLLLVAANKK